MQQRLGFQISQGFISEVQSVLFGAGNQGRAEVGKDKSFCNSQSTFLPDAMPGKLPMLCHALIYWGVYYPQQLVAEFGMKMY